MDALRGEAIPPFKNKGGRPRKEPGMTEAELTAAAAQADAANQGGVDQAKTEGSPAVDVSALLKTPEAQAAISVATEMAVQAILAKMQAARPAEAPTAEPSGPDLDFARTMAMEIARLADQGSNKKRIAPEVLLKRESAREHMEDLIVEFREQDITPVYGLKRAVYLDETLVQPTYTNEAHRQCRTEIGWPLVPNEAMDPINDAARQIHAAFIASIGGLTPKLQKSNTDGGSLLKVLHETAKDRTPEVGRGQAPGNLRMMRGGMSGEVVETAVLGTVAARARQLA